MGKQKEGICRGPKEKPDSTFRPAKSYTCEPAWGSKKRWPRKGKPDYNQSRLSTDKNTKAKNHSKRSKTHETSLSKKNPKNDAKQKQQHPAP